MIPLDRVIGQNMPGLCYFDVVDVNDVLTMPEMLGNAISTPVVLYPGKSWHRVYTAPPGCVFGEKWTVKNGLPIADCSVNAFVGKDELAKLTALWNLPTTRFLVLASGMNGDAILLGRKDEGCMGLATARQRGNESTRQNGYVLDFGVRRSEPAPYYLATAPIPVPGCPTLAQLLISTTLEELVSSLPIALYNELDVYFDGGACPTLQDLVAAASNTEILGALSQAQAEYIAEYMISVIDGGDSTDDASYEVDGGDGDTPPPDPANEFDAADFEPADFITS